MGALCTLWLGLVLLGVLGALQTSAQAQVSLQPNFQQDKVRGSGAQSRPRHSALSGEGLLSVANRPGKRRAELEEEARENFTLPGPSAMPPLEQGH